MNSNSKGCKYYDKQPKQPETQKVQHKEDLDEVLEFVWTKIQERFYRMAEAFRYFDTENHTTVNKSELRYGLERLKVKLTPNQLDLLFNYLDRNRIGYFTYNDFCKLAEEKRR